MKVKFKTVLTAIIFELIIMPAILLCQDQSQLSGPYQTTGIRIGEVTRTEAIIWTRLTLNPKRVGSDAPFPSVRYKDPSTGDLVKIKSGNRPNLEPVAAYPDGFTVKNIQGAVPGTEGRVRVLYKTKGSADWLLTSWSEVEADHDYTHQFKLVNLFPDTEYELRIESESLGGIKGQVVEGKFKTAPKPDQIKKIVFTVVTCQNYVSRDDGENGFKIYPQILKLNPDFFVHTGDIIYYDQLAKNIDLARWYWQIIYSYPSNVEFHRWINSYFMKDDHDTWMNDAYPGMKTKFMGEFTFKQGQQVFLDEVPMGEKTYRTFRWGKDLQIWLPEGRDFRSDNDAPDGPEKTIWGKEQKEWFKKTVQESDATFRILISPTPLVGPDRGENKSDNHANEAFATEGSELRHFVANQKNMIVINGDRHWQYASKDLETGLREFGCGSFTDKHAGGWSNDQVLPEHEYVNVVGGFLTVTIERIEDKPLMTVRHYSVDGKILHEYKQFAQ